MGSPQYIRLISNSPSQTTLPGKACLLVFGEKRQVGQQNGNERRVNLQDTEFNRELKHGMG